VPFKGDYSCFHKRRCRPRTISYEQRAIQQLMAKGTIVPYACQLEVPHYRPLPPAETTPVTAAGSIVCAVTLTAAHPFRNSPIETHESPSSEAHGSAVKAVRGKAALVPRY